MKSEKQIRERLKKFREEKATFTHLSSNGKIYRLNKKIEELEWMLEEELKCL